MPTLGQEIRRLREEKGWNQKTLCQKAKLDTAIVSRIESGKSKNPSRDTIRQLAVALEIPESDLLSIAAGLLQRDRSTLRLGVAHCLWSAPVILLAMQRRLQAVSLTSYGVMEDAATSLGVPYWYDEQTLRQQGFVKAGPVPVKCDAPTLSQIQEWPSEAALHTYTANDLIALLTSDPPAVDGIVAARAAVESYSKDTLPCAQLLRAEGGCSVIVGLSDAKFSNVALASDASPEAFLNVWKKKQSLWTLSAAGTIAEQHLRELRVKVTNKEKPLFDPADYVDLGVWPKVVANIETALTGNGPGQSGAFAFVGWEPQLSWVKATAKQKGAKCFGPWPAGEFTRDKLPSFSFDVILRKNVLSQETANGIRAFFNDLNAAARQLNALRSAPSSAATSSAVMLVARYLNLSPEQCAQGLLDMDFQLMFYPEWVDYLQG